MNTIDNLQIEINAKATTANTAIDNLIVKLGKLTTSISHVNSTKLNGLATGIQRVGTASRSAQSNLNNTAISANKATKSFTSLASAIGKFYATYFLAIRGIKSLWRSIESTADYIEAYNYFNVALGKIGSDWQHQWTKYADKIGVSSAEEYAESFSKRLSQSIQGLSGVTIKIEDDGTGLLTSTGIKNLGLNIKEVTQYASQLASVTNSVGQVGEVSLATASAFTKLGADISSLFNIDYSQAMTNLQSGLIGQSRALYKYGIDITNATLQTYAYELGLSKAVSEMSQMEKMQLRTIAILQQSKVAWGDLANTISSPSNLIRQLKNNVQELGIVFGQLFMPALQKVLPVINGLTIALKNLFTNVAGLLGIKLDLSSFGQGYVDLGEDVDDLTGSINEATKATKKFKSATIGIDKLNILSQDENAGAENTGGLPTVDLTDEILDATSEYEKAWQQAYDKMQNKAQQIADTFSLAFEPILKLFKDIAKGDWFAAGQNTSNLVSGIFDFFSNAIANVNWDEIGKNVGEFLEGVDWTDIFSSLGELIWKGINAGLDLYSSMFDAAPAETAILTAFAALKFTGLGDIVGRKIVNSITGYFSSISFFDLMSGLFSTTSGVAMLGSPNFAKLGSDIIGGLEKVVEDLIGSDASKELGEHLFMIFTGVFPGAIMEALYGMQYGESTVGGRFLATLGELLFDFKYASAFANNAKTFLDKAINEFMEQDFIDAGIMLTEAIGSGLLAGIAFLTTPLTSVGDKIIETIFPDKSTLGELCEDTYGSITGWFEDTFAVDFESIWDDIETTLSDFWDEFTNIPKDAINLVIGYLNNFIGAMESALNFVVEGINGLSVEIPDWVPEIGGEKLGFNIPEFSFGQIPTFKVGGFPEDGLFFANHSELVGKFSNGKTAVANNAQIVAGIEQGVRNAMYEVMANGNFGGNITINNETTLDGRVVGQSVNKFNASTGKQIFGNQTNYNFG